MNKNDVKSSLKNIDRLIKNKNYDEALPLVTVLLKQEKENFSALIFAGAINTELHNFKAAKTSFLKAVELQPDRQLAWDGLFKMFYDNKVEFIDYDLAKSVYHRYIPDDSVPLKWWKSVVGLLRISIKEHTKGKTELDVFKNAMQRVEECCSTIPQPILFEFIYYIASFNTIGRELYDEKYHLYHDVLFNIPQKGASPLHEPFEEIDLETYTAVVNDFCSILGNTAKYNQSMSYDDYCWLFLGKYFVDEPALQLCESLAYQNLVQNKTGSLLRLIEQLKDSKLCHSDFRYKLALAITSMNDFNTEKFTSEEQVLPILQCYKVRSDILSMHVDVECVSFKSWSEVPSPKSLSKRRMVNAFSKLLSCAYYSATLQREEMQASLEQLLSYKDVVKDSKLYEALCDTRNELLFDVVMSLTLSDISTDLAVPRTCKKQLLSDGLFDFILTVMHLCQLSYCLYFTVYVDVQSLVGPTKFCAECLLSICESLLGNTNSARTIISNIERPKDAEDAVPFLGYPSAALLYDLAISLQSCIGCINGDIEDKFPLEALLVSVRFSCDLIVVCSLRAIAMVTDIKRQRTMLGSLLEAMPSDRSERARRAAWFRRLSAASMVLEATSERDDARRRDLAARAAAAFDRAQATHADAVTAAFFMSNCHQLANRYNSALGLIEGRVLKRDDISGRVNFDGLMFKANLLRKLCRYREAEEACRELVNIVGDGKPNVMIVDSDIISLAWLVLDIHCATVKQMVKSAQANFVGARKRITLRDTLFSQFFSKERWWKIYEKNHVAFIPLLRAFVDLFTSCTRLGSATFNEMKDVMLEKWPPQFVRLLLLSSSHGFAQLALNTVKIAYVLYTRDDGVEKSDDSKICFEIDIATCLLYSALECERTSSQRVELAKDARGVAAGLLQKHQTMPGETAVRCLTIVAICSLSTLLNLPKDVEYCCSTIESIKGATSRVVAAELRALNEYEMASDSDDTGNSATLHERVMDCVETDPRRPVGWSLKALLAVRDGESNALALARLASGTLAVSPLVRTELTAKLYANALNESAGCETRFPALQLQASESPPQLFPSKIDISQHRGGSVLEIILAAARHPSGNGAKSEIYNEAVQCLEAVGLGDDKDVQMLRIMAGMRPKITTMVSEDIFANDCEVKPLLDFLQSSLSESNDVCNFDRLKLNAERLAEDKPGLVAIFVLFFVRQHYFTDEDTMTALNHVQTMCLEYIGTSDAEENDAIESERVVLALVMCALIVGDEALLEAARERAESSWTNRKTVSWLSFMLMLRSVSTQESTSALKVAVTRFLHENPDCDVARKMLRIVSMEKNSSSQLLFQYPFARLS